MDIIPILEATISNVQQERDSSLKFLEEAAIQDFPVFALTLAKVLANVSASVFARSAAGLHLKNLLASKDQENRETNSQRWLRLDLNQRDEMKNLVISSLGTEESRPSISAQVIAAIAYPEFQVKQWPDLVKILSIKVLPDKKIGEREAALDALGYLCQDLTPSMLIPYSGELLTAIVQCMSKSETNTNVRYSATKALLDSLEIASSNFKVELERNFIMQVICESTTFNDMRVKVTGLQCLVRIVNLYYQYLESYMTSALFSITFEAMKSKDDDVALQGIEFWSTVCDEEMEMELLDNSIKDSEGILSKNYSKSALPYIVPVLLERLISPSDEDDGDDDLWNPSKAAGVCLMILTNYCKNFTIQYVHPFISKNITHQDPCHREAAILAMGSILDGPDLETLYKALNPLIENVLVLTLDQQVFVRDTAFWTLGRIIEKLPDVLNNRDILEKVIKTVKSGLRDVPRVATNSCWTLSYTFGAVYIINLNEDSNSRPQSTAMSPHFESLMAEVFQTIDRRDSNQKGLRPAAFESLMKMIECHSLEDYPTVLKCFGHVAQLLNSLQNMQSSISSSQDYAQFSDLQSLYCAVIQSLIRSILQSDVQRSSSSLMGMLISSLALTRSQIVQEDIFMTIGTLFQYSEKNFVCEAAEPFFPILLQGLRSFRMPTVCISALTVLSDLCHTLEAKILPFCNGIVEILFVILNSVESDKSLWSHSISVFGDIAIAVGTAFEPYLHETLKLIGRFSCMKIKNFEDIDEIELVDDIRSALLQAYSSIVQGSFHNQAISMDQFNSLVPYLNQMFSLIEDVNNDLDRSDSMLCDSCGLLGDLAYAFKSRITGIVPKSAYELLESGKKSYHSKTQNVVNWAVSMIHEIS